MVICNKSLPTHNERSYEMDFIVVGKRWVFLLDEKSWRGKIVGNDEQWVRADGSSERSPLAKVDYVAKLLAGRIGWIFPPLESGGDFWLRGVLLSVSDELPIFPTELRDFYQREFKVLKELHNTGLVAEVETPFIWSDNFFIVPIVPLRGKPLSTYPLPETDDELSQELLLAAACFKGLDTIHSRGIIHRAIGPDTVYVLQGGQNPKIAFANFFAARMGANSIAASLEKLALVAEDPYASIDLAVGYEYATTVTDIFSLALVFLERIAGASTSTIRANVESDFTFPDIQHSCISIPHDITSELTTPL